MASRKDQLWSYQFMLQRVMSALVYRKTDADKNPFKSAAAASFAGVMIAVLALGATLAIAFFADQFGKNVDWTKGGVVIMDEDTGAPYVVFPSDDQLATAGEAADAANKRLYPVANFTSAALLAGTTETIEVAGRSLSGDEVEDDVDPTDVPQMGDPVGIVDLPTSLPAADQLLDPAWAVCTDPGEDDEGAESMLYVGAQPDAGRTLDADQAVIITEGDQTYVVGERGYKHLVVDPGGALVALALGQAEQVPAAPAFTKALPEGAKLELPVIPRDGDPSDALSGYTIGDVYRQSSGENAEYYVVLEDGAAPITQVQAQLLVDGDLESVASEAEVARAADREADYYDDYIPDPDADPALYAMRPPERITEVPEGWGQGVACGGYREGDESAEVMLDVEVRSQGIATQQRANGSVYADRIVIPPGRGMLVGTGEEGVGALQLITGWGGQRFPLGVPSGNDEQRLIVAPATARTALGYGKAEPVAMPTHLMELVPEGPVLDPNLAMQSAVGQLPFAGGEGGDSEPAEGTTGEPAETSSTEPEDGGEDGGDGEDE